MLRRIAACALALLVTLAPTASAAQTSPRADFSVVVAPEPLKATGGSEITAVAKVTNNLPVRVEYRVSVVPVTPQDEGRITLGGPGNPLTRAARAPSVVSVEPGATSDVPVVVPVPASIEADIYFVGVLVAPIAQGDTAGPITQLQILEHFAVDVTGRADRSLRTEITSDPRVALGSRLGGRIAFVNDGTAGLQIRRSAMLEKRYGAGAASTPIELAGSPLELLPESTTKTFDYQVEVEGFTLAFARISTRAVYTDDQGTDVAVPGSGPLVLVTDEAGAAVAITLLLLIAAGLLVLLAKVTLRAKAKRSFLPEPTTPAAETVR